MALTARLRWLGFVAFALLALTRAAQAQFPLTLEPKVVETASAVTLTVTSNGAIDLSGITIRQVSFFDFRQGDGQELQISIRKIDATARKLTVTADIVEPEALGGGRKLHLIFGDVRVSFSFMLVRPFVCPASCQPPRMCVNKICVLPPTKCNPRCQLPRVCNEERKRCEIPQ